MKSVEPSQNSNGGWIITFSDSQSIELTNGADGADGTNGIDGLTPYLLVDQDGYWCISYDNGNTFTRMMDNSGNYIKAIGEKGDKGDQGEKGDKG
ncbi:MAG: hypothetical protein IKA38_00700, partial [Alistipes sp.]|nr:hypothetical protein [Alistipes sp.]